MTDKPNIKINLPGGLVSPAHLKNILEIAEQCAVETMHFGARQQLLFFVHERERELFNKKMNENGFNFDSDSETNPNITSTFAFANLFSETGENWLSEGKYLDILNELDFPTALKINICDSTHSHAPFFTGHLNFISSDVPHFWFCYIRYPKTNTVERFHSLVYSEDLRKFIRRMLDFGLLALEKQNSDTGNRTLNIGKLKPETISVNSVSNLQSPMFNVNTEGIILREIVTDLNIPRFVMPYYEGINILPDGKLWLGIYRRKDDFPVKFLIELCQLCEETRIGNIGISNWRSLVIKGIEKSDRLKWEKLLGKYGINVRHAANELNWQTEDDSPSGAALKQYLVKKLGRMDMRTFGLVFAIKMRHKSEVFGSVIIRREPMFRFGNFEPSFFGLFDSYDIFYAQDFNPHTRKRKTFRLGIPKSRLPEELANLSKKYFTEFTGTKKTVRSIIKPASKINPTTQTIYRCKDCWSVFDETTEGISFEETSTDYICPMCEAAKTEFEIVLVN